MDPDRESEPVAEAAPPSDTAAAAAEPEPPIEAAATGTAQEPSARRWRYEPFLTPAAILLGAILISATIFVVDRDGDFGLPLASSGPTPGATTETLLPPGGASGSTAQNLRAALNTYAGELGIDTGRFDQCVGRGDTILINRQFQRGQQAGVSGTPTFFINNKKIVGAQPSAIFDEVIAAELKGSPASLEGYSPAILQLAQAGRFEIVAARPDISDAPIEGKASAKVVIAEFSDFQCPFCKQWTDNNLSRLRPRFGDDVALAFLHFPIQQIHPNAPYVHVAAVCAAEQGKFWPMHDLLFARQQEWAGLRVN